MVLVRYVGFISLSVLSVFFVNAFNVDDFVPICSIIDDPCKDNDDCCSGNCSAVPTDLENPDALQLLCQKMICSASGSICNSNSACCSGNCNPLPYSQGGVCRDSPCAALDHMCTSDSDCCSTNCNTDTCLCESRYIIF